MNSNLNFLFISTLFLAALTLIVSIYPGVLQDFLSSFVLIVLWLFILLGVLIAAVAILIQSRRAFSRTAIQRSAIVLLIILFTYGLLKFYVPRRIAFTLSRPAFQQWLVSHSAQPQRSPSQEQPLIQPLNQQLGFYQVDEYRSDPRGGSYFRVYSHGDGLGPDRVSYGFVYQPNATGSPFGDAAYRTHALTDGWFWFRASDDW